MKKVRLKTRLNTKILLLGILVFLQSCSKDEIKDFQIPKGNNVSLEKLVLSEFESTNFFKYFSSKNTSKFDVNKSSTKSTSKNDYTILTNVIFKANYLDYEAYTYNPLTKLYTP
jgi:hypothetical protein